MDNRMKVYGVIAGLIRSTKISCDESRSSDGTSIVFTIKNYPSFPSGTETVVIVTYPYTWLDVSTENGHVTVRPNRMNSSSVKFWQGSVGTPFNHAHIFDDGRPCWGHDNNDLTTVQEVVKHLILTLRCEYQ